MEAIFIFTNIYNAYAEILWLTIWLFATVRDCTRRCTTDCTWLYATVPLWMFTRSSFVLADAWNHNYCPIIRFNLTVARSFQRDLRDLRDLRALFYVIHFTYYIVIVYHLS